MDIQHAGGLTAVLSDFGSIPVGEPDFPADLHRRVEGYLRPMVERLVGQRPNVAPVHYIKHSPRLWEPFCGYFSVLVDGKGDADALSVEVRICRYDNEETFILSAGIVNDQTGRAYFKLPERALGSAPPDLDEYLICSMAEELAQHPEELIRAYDLLADGSDDYG